jgi:tetratricopeptide (TPR) repeat protein
MTAKPMSCESMLEHLLELSMAQTGGTAGRYRLHALMREFARALCGENLYDAESRMAEFYCEVAKTNGSKLHGEGWESALAILDREVSNIFAGQKWARENETRKARELTRDFIYGAMANYFSLRANWAEWIEWSEYGIAACEKLGDEKAAGAIAGNLGSVYFQKGEWDKAIAFYQKSLDTKERVGDAHGMAQTFNNLGIVYRQKGEWDKAIAFYQQALQTMERVGDAVGISSTSWNLGLLLKEQNKLAEAIQWMEKCVVIEEKLGHPDAMKDRAEVEELKRRLDQPE